MLNRNEIIITDCVFLMKSVNLDKCQIFGIHGSTASNNKLISLIDRYMKISVLNCVYLPTHGQNKEALFNYGCLIVNSTISTAYNHWIRKWTNIWILNNWNLLNTNKFCSETISFLLCIVCVKILFWILYILSNNLR